MPALLFQPHATPATVPPIQPHRLPQRRTATANGFLSTHLRPLAGVLAALCLAVASPVQAQLQETTNRIGITVVSIPAGSFVMGSCEMGAENKKTLLFGPTPVACRTNPMPGWKPRP